MQPMRTPLMTEFGRPAPGRTVSAARTRRGNTTPAAIAAARTRNARRVVDSRLGGIVLMEGEWLIRISGVTHHRRLIGLQMQFRSSYTKFNLSSRRKAAQGKGVSSVPLCVAQP